MFKRLKSMKILDFVVVIIAFAFMITIDRTQQPFTSLRNIALTTILLYLGLSTSVSLFIWLRMRYAFKIAVGSKRVLVISVMAIMFIGFHLLIFANILSVYRASELIDTQLQSLREWSLYVGGFICVMGIIWTPNQIK